MNVPSFVNREMRATVSGVAFSPCPEWPSATKISPFGATSTLHGSVRASGGFPAIPARPSVSSTFPSGLNFTTVWPLPIASGFFFSSRSFAPRISTTHTLPSRSTYILWGKMNMPAPKLFRRLPDESNLSTGGTDEPAQLSYVNGETPGGTSGFAPHRSATHTDSPSLSIATPFSAPHFLPSGRFPHGATDWYGLGRSLVGWTSATVRYGTVVAQAPKSVIEMIVTNSNNFNRDVGAIGPLLVRIILRRRRSRFGKRSSAWRPVVHCWSFAPMGGCAVRLPFAFSKRTHEGRDLRLPNRGRVCADPDR